MKNLLDWIGVRTEWVAPKHSDIIATVKKNAAVVANLDLTDDIKTYQEKPSMAQQRLRVEIAKKKMQLT